jgi:hypothetical protein
MMKRTTTGELVLGLALSAAALFGLHATGAQKEEKAPPREGAGPMMQCPMMAGLHDLHLYADSPSVLLLKGAKLKLTEKQKAQLEKIDAAARRRARRVLNDEQREQLKEAPKGPLSMMQLSRAGMKKGMAGKGMMCPMCMKMMQKMREKEGSPKK